MEDKFELSPSDAESAEMKAGSVLIWTGSLYHGAGENRSDVNRIELTIQDMLAWLRQEENQYLSVSDHVL